MSIETLIACSARRERLPAGIQLPVTLVRRQGLAPLADALGASGFAHEAIASSLIHEQQERAAAEASTAIAALGIPLMFIKGMAAARRHYDAPGERPMTDIDIIVPADAHGDAARALTMLGYSPVSVLRERSRFHHALTLKRTGSAVDLHRSVVQRARRGATIDGLWLRARQAPKELGTAFVPGPVDEALLTLAHIARHELAVRALSYVDAARMLASIDRGELEHRARRVALWRGVSAAIEITDALTTERWPKRLHAVREEITCRHDLSRPRQLWRKVSLLEGPVEAGRLIFGAILEQLRV